MDFNTDIYVWFDENLPFEPLRDEYIYVETEYNPYLNNFFRRLYLPNCSGCDFCYLPDINKSIDGEHLQYMFPYLSIVEMEDKVTPITYELLLSHLLPQSRGIIKNGLILFSDRDEHGYKFNYYGIHESDYKRLSRELYNHTNPYRNSPSMVRGISNFGNFGKKDWDDDEYADRHFFETTSLAAEIVARVHKLRVLGVSEAAIRSLLDVPVVISRLVITREFRILLPEYDLEIKMTPLTKAVYILFLLHPEGIMFKRLPEYRDELLEIYQSLTNRSDYDAILKSITDVTDPTKNSINEKCTRIREAFINEFRSDLAEYYCIRGKFGDPKAIELDRSKLEFEDQAFLQALQKYRSR